MPRGVYERKPRFREPRPLIMCRVDGCGRLANRPAMALCERHYYRRRAHGSFDLKLRQRGVSLDRNGYRRISAPGHPAASKRGGALEHRVIFYDAHGGGPFNCHWCSRSIDWAHMHVDHVNCQPGDNRLDNLVASCARCNITRGQDKSIAANRARGLNLTLHGETRSVGEWAKHLGIDKVSLKWRLSRGWSVERALTTPRGRFGPRAAR